MKKKVLTALLCTLIFSLSGCQAGKKDGGESENKGNTVSSEVLNDGTVVGQNDDNANNKSDKSENADPKDTASESAGVENPGMEDGNVGNSIIGATDKETQGKYVPLQEHAMHMSQSQIVWSSVMYNPSEDGYGYALDLSWKEEDTLEGLLDFKISDFDGDGEEELLTIEVHKTGKQSFDFVANMFENQDGQVVLQDSFVLLKDPFNSVSDRVTLRFFLKDGKVLLMDFENCAYVSADGVEFIIKGLEYQNQKFQQCLDCNIAGSDFYEAGADSNYAKVREDLRSLGLGKTAEGLEKRDVFAINPGDEGVTTLFKLTQRNNYRWGDSEYSPFGYFNLVQGMEAVDDYILPQSSTRLLTESDLKNLNSSELKLARNEIYARYGWSFQNEDLQWYFSQKAWYKQVENIDDAVLTEFEKKNRDLIAEMEKKAPEHVDYQKESARVLQESELEEIESYFKKVENNGFLCSTFRDPRDMNLNEVFYCGAGIAEGWNEELNEELNEEFLQVISYGEIETDVTYVVEEAVSKLLLDKTGYDLKDMNAYLTWCYLPKAKMYACEHGDTNYMPIEVQEGYELPEGKIAFVYYVSWAGDFGTKYVAIIEKEAGTYRVLSNVEY